MTRLPAALTAMIFWCFAFVTPVWADAAANLRLALREMRDDNWTEALSIAGERGSVARDIIVWHWLRRSYGTDGDALVFAERRADWPGMDYLRKQAEPQFTNADPDRVLQFYRAMPPQSAEGVLNHAVALISKGQRGDAEAELVKAWRTLPMGAGLQKDFIENFGKLLKPHHEARLDRMLWDGYTISARQMLSLVDEDQRKLAAARIALKDMEPGVDSLIAAVPAALADAPGLAHDRFVWRDRKELDDSAIELMLERSVSAESLGEPDKWGNARARLARLLMRQEENERAYKVAALHFMTPEMGYTYAELEWIAGYIALAKLNDPSAAVIHFQRFDAAVNSPISKGRSGYWLGRAHAALGDAEKAHAAYSIGAENQTSFYGLLAAERIGRPFDPILRTPPKNPPWRDAPFMQSSVLEAGLLLLRAGELDLAERFLTHLAESLDEGQASQLADMALEMGQPHLALMIAKRKAQEGVVLAGAYYPLHPVADLELPMAPEMVLAIARRESEFDPVVISGAGARGLMQVMPATAELVADGLGILGGHSTDNLTQDWKYNAKLGANYLAGLAGSFDGNVVMMAAGYNAGPNRPISWMERFGDPRTGNPDVVDWIEHIPFEETRNYIMRVTESLPVYRARLGQEPLPIPFSAELAGATLRAFAP